MLENIKSFDSIGVGLKPQHYNHILQNQPKVGWFEIHAENFMGQGGLSHRYLSQISEHYPLSIHGVCLSLGSSDGLDKSHLKQLKILIDRYQPFLVSEHISWSRLDGSYLNDLLPLPYNKESFEIVKNNINQTQDFLHRQILVENPSSYLGFKQSTDSEPEFLNRLIEQTGCGLLLDINNVFVSAHNQDFDAFKYIDQINCDAVGEIHLAGHTANDVDGQTILIDDHGSPICSEVGELYKYYYKQSSKKAPVLIERDNNIPEFEVLMNEVAKVQRWQEESIKIKQVI
jgi:uncharacterized protein (UPF0276 family)